MAPRAFTVFQDVPTTEAVRAKPVTSGVMMTRSSARLNNVPQALSTVDELTPTDKENVHPLTGERAGLNTTSKKRKTNVLTAKSPTTSTTKTRKSVKDVKDTEPQSKKRKASSESTKSKATTRKDGRASVSSRKPIKLATNKSSTKLPRVEEEGHGKCQEPEHTAQAEIDSRCYELTVKPLADISPAYVTVDSTRDESTSPASKVKFHKDSFVEHGIHDLFSSSQTLVSLPSSSSVRASSSEPPQVRKFSTPERKQIYAAFTFSSPSPTSERLKCPSQDTISPLKLA